MRIIYFLLVLFISNHLNFVFSSPLSANDIFSFISPVPNSEYNSISTNIILKTKDINIINNLSTNNFIVRGSVSGYHKGNIQIIDYKTIIFKANTNFNYGEIVSVTINGISSSNNKNTSVFFSFTTASKKINFNFFEYFKKDFGFNNNYNSVNYGNPNKIKKEYDSLPSDFPVITILQNDNPAQGNIFLSDFSFDTSNHSASTFLMVINNAGFPVWYRKMPAYCFDFKPQNNNTYTYCDGSDQKFYALDSLYNIIDSFSCGNGYTTDAHDLRFLTNGHVLLLGDDAENVDMSKIVPGGNPNAVVLGDIIQELDQNKNVVWQWRSWDHYKITDATHEILTDTLIDYVHANALEIDQDGNILLSCRHMDEITKIDYETGNIIWRLSGKNNQFTFINDTIQLSHQHAVRILPNGDLTIFDNGNFHNPMVSRAVEYQLNQSTKTCTLVWEYRNPLMTYGAAMGYVERLSTGNTLIGWGAANPTVTEVNPEGEKVLELSFPPGFFSYIAIKLEPGQIFTLPTVKAERYVLEQNYPNPFNPTTHILYEIPTTTFVSLKVYDILGRLVKTLINETQTEGRYSFTLDSKDFSSDVYFYTLAAGNFRETKKLVIVK